jgi:prophage antirepressor-like protein
MFEQSIVSVIIDNNDKTWFNGSDVTKAIGYSDSRDAIRTHTRKTDKIQLKK